MTARPDVVVVGAGLAGCEAALQLAGRGFKVRLYEQKPAHRSEASNTDGFAELVCSNSLRSAAPENAVGMLKQEMQRLGSFIMAAAHATEIPAGGALAVDRDRFSEWITARVKEEPGIELVEALLDDVPFDCEEIILATGPLTGKKLAENLARRAGSENLHFYDAIAPIVDADSIDRSIAFSASRYDKGGDDYLNLPFDREQYEAFVQALVDAEKVPPRPFEKPKYFEGCLPIDLLAERGAKTLSFGAMKPVGLIDPNTGKRPHAVVQLRAENEDASAYNMVGFQTRLTQPEQQRIFRTIPGLQEASFQRLGSVHRNTFIHAPGLVDRHLRLRRDPRISFAGQLSGVEGYVESAACGLLVGILTASRLARRPVPPPPAESMIGAMLNYLVLLREDFQPSNVTHSMLPPLPKPEGRRKLGKRERKQACAERAKLALERWLQNPDLVILENRE